MALSRYILGFFLCLSSSEAALPPDAQALLESLPGKTLSLDLVVSRAIQSSDSFRAISAEKVKTLVSKLNAEALLDFQFRAEGSYLNNRNEVPSVFQPNQTKSTSGLLGVSKLFPTGTLIDTSVQHGYAEIRFAPTGGPDPSRSYHETRFKISLIQNLWKDSFGYSTSRALEAGSLAYESAEFAFDESVETWLTDLVKIYYNAWLAKARVRTAEAGVARQERLVNVTRIKAQRGTAEQPDVIQVQSTLSASHLQAEQARESLRKIWRDLVISLKLPEKWLSIDPYNIPIELENPVPGALKACGTAEKPAAPPEESTQTLKAQKLAEAAKLTAESAANSANPDLNLSVSLDTNGQGNNGGSETWGEAFRVEHPAWAAKVTLKIPLGFSAEEAQLRTAQSNFIRAEAVASDTTNRLKVNWINECAELRRLDHMVSTLREVFESQVKRTQLEERRFRLGRSQPLQVIQADADATETELQLRSSEMNVRLSAWKIRQMLRQIKPYLETLLKNPPQLVKASNSSSETPKENKESEKL